MVLLTWYVWKLKDGRHRKMHVATVASRSLSGLMDIYSSLTSSPYCRYWDGQSADRTNRDKDEIWHSGNTKR